jgi:ABC-type glycerol-3-phosphate transport system permease component
MAAISKRLASRAPSIAIGRIGLWAALIVVFVIMVTPFAWMVSTSLKRPADIYAPTPKLLPRDLNTGELYLTFENYRYVLASRGLGRAFLNSLIVVGVLVPVKLLINALAAYAFARIPFPGRDKLFLLLLGSIMVPGIALLIPRVFVTQSLGLYNTLGGIIVPLAVSVFDVFLIRQFFLTLPVELEEAAMIDGAGRLRIFWQIAVPLARPVLAVVTITSFIFHWNDFLWPLVIINNPDRYTLPIALALLNSTEVARPYYTMAGATIAILPVILVFLIFQRHIIDGITITGLKG